MAESEIIISRDNAKLAAARKVRDGRDRSRIFIEGTRLALEALGSDIEIEFCFVSEMYSNDELVDAAAALCTVFRVGEKAFASITDTPAPQGIVLIAKRPSQDVKRIRTIQAELPLIVYLFEINNPANLGAVIRSAEAAGALGVMISPDSADGFSPKALRSAMGSAFRLPVVEHVSFEHLKSWAEENSFSLIAVDIQGEKDHASHDWKRQSVLVMGSEAHGLPNDLVTQMHANVRIEMNANVESLNLAVSAGVLLFEARRQILAGR